MTRENGVYTFALHLEMVGGYSLEATYTGGITIIDGQQAAPRSHDMARNFIRMDSKVIF